MKPGTIPRVELARKITDLPPYRIGQWVLAGTPTTEPYPCTCRYDPCRYLKCPDRYRTEGEDLPWGCCGRAGHTRAADAGRLVAEAARKAPGFAPRDTRTAWERRLPTEPGAVVAEAGLWDTGADEAPPEWDAIDDGLPVHEEPPGDAWGYSDTPEPSEAERKQAEELWRAVRARLEAAQCDCRTPWDADPPTLLWAADAKATAAERSFALSAKPGADARAEADRAIELSGGRRTKPWRQGRHALLPPVGKSKTRECWSAPLDTGEVAVIDLPPEPTGGGVHCADCCRNFQNAGAWEMHRKRQRDGRHRCVDPASVVLVPSGTLGERSTAGTPLLKCTIGGVWGVDTLAVWDGKPPAEGAMRQLWYQTQDRLAAARGWRFGKGHNR